MGPGLPILRASHRASRRAERRRDHRLEIRVKTHWPLALILLNVPGDAWFTSTVHVPPAGMDFLIQFPEPGRTSAPIRRGHPASCPVRVAASAHGTVTAFAKCRNEHGRTWENVKVTITPVRPDVSAGSGTRLSRHRPGHGSSVSRKVLLKTRCGS